MMVLVVGGASSGKSAYAEKLFSRLAGRLPADAPRYYIATMEAADPESLRRVERHRLARAGKGFTTVECPRNPGGLRLIPGGAALLECMGNLCANELYGGHGATETTAETRILSGVDRLKGQCRHLVVVSNEVFRGGTDYAGDTLRYLRLLGRLNRRLAALSDAVCEVACGIPVYYKGAEPWDAERGGGNS